MVFRGPKRSCRPCRAGCEDTAAVDTTSADSGEVAAGDGAVKELLGRKVEVNVGRRGERHVYVLAKLLVETLRQLKVGGGRMCMYRCERAEMRGARSGRARRMMEFILKDSSGLGGGGYRALSGANWWGVCLDVAMDDFEVERLSDGVEILEASDWRAVGGWWVRTVCAVGSAFLMREDGIEKVLV